MKAFYEDHFCTIYHGDCREILPCLDFDIDLVLADPPYETSFGGGGIQGAGIYQNPKLLELATFDFDSHIPMMLERFSRFVFFHSRNQIQRYARAAADRKLRYDLHFWHKTDSPPFISRYFKSDIEYIALIWNPKVKMVHATLKTAPISYFSKLFQSRTLKAGPDKVHPAQKPIELLEKYICMLNGQWILDPFMGGGSTLVAAKRLGRRAIGIERDEAHCEAAAKRLQRVLLTPGQE